MSKNVEYPERYQKYLLSQIRSSNIKHDCKIVYATIEDVVQIMRIDTIPLPCKFTDMMFRSDEDIKKEENQKKETEDKKKENKQKLGFGELGIKLKL